MPILVIGRCGHWCGPSHRSKRHIFAINMMGLLSWSYCQLIPDHGFYLTVRLSLSRSLPVREIGVPWLQAPG